MEPGSDSVATTTNHDTTFAGRAVGAAESKKKPHVTVGEVSPGWTAMRPVCGKNNKDGKGDGYVSPVLSDNGSRGSILLNDDNGANTLGDISASTTGRTLVDEEGRSDDELLGDGQDGSSRRRRDNGSIGGHPLSNELPEDPLSGHTEVYKVYRQRWFGMIQLVLLNIIVSWDWLSFAANSKTCAQYYNVSESAINWLSTLFLFGFVAISPIVLYTLHHGGPKPAIIAASVLILVGNWIRYISTRVGDHGHFGGVIFGQILSGLAQPFVLSAPTRYSDLWFTNNGRVAATAVMSLANPFGGALAQLIDPFWAGKPSDIPNMVLYIAIISSVASLPSFFIPRAPPTPVSPSSLAIKKPLLPSIRQLFTTPEFYLIFLPFTIYVGFFNSISSLINQILEPYSFTEDQAGIAGACLIIVGLLTSAIASPIIDRTKIYLGAIKFCVPVIALSYLAFLFAPETRSQAVVYVILAILGAASFSLVPIVLEYLIEITHPVSPEVTSTICWSGGQLAGGIFILISDRLRAGGENDGSRDDGSSRPDGNMYRALVFQAVVAMMFVPLPLALGCCGRGKEVRMRRVEADRRRGIDETEEVLP